MIIACFDVVWNVLPMICVNTTKRTTPPFCRLVLDCCVRCSFSWAEVDSWVEWAFSAHAESGVIRSALKTLSGMSQLHKFRDGVQIGSFCSGWGVSEMVLEALNDKHINFGRQFPKVHASYFSDVFLNHCVSECPIVHCHMWPVFCI